MSDFHQNGNSLVASGDGVLKDSENVTVNGSNDLSAIITGNDGAKVYSIRMDMKAGTWYDHTITVDGQGPSGFGSGWFNLKFTDQSGDTYSLGLYSSTRKSHTVSFDSKSPYIDKITWD